MNAVAAFFLAVSFAPADEAPADLQGRWELVSVEADGKADPLAMGRPRFQIVGDKIRYGGEDVAVLDADAGASPRSVDLRFTAPMRTYEGIYARQGATLKICLNGRVDGAKERPDAFSTRGKDAWRLLTLRRLAEGEADRAEPGFVGLALRLDNERKEVVVQGILEDSPAAKAGLKEGDVLLAIAEAEVATLPAAVEAVRRTRPGDTLTLRIRRDGEASEVRARVAALAAALPLRTRLSPAHFGLGSGGGSHDLCLLRSPARMRRLPRPVCPAGPGALRRPLAPRGRPDLPGMRRRARLPLVQDAV
jgi:uncharacterized protein (TIGR03067 family)